MMMTMMAISAFAGEPTNHFKANVPAEAGEAVVAGVAYAWAREGDAKLKLKLYNGTSDYLVFKTGGMKLELGPSSIPAEDKIEIVNPKSMGDRILTFAGSGLYVESGRFVPDGVLRVPSDLAVQVAPDFRLPVATKTFSAGNFDCGVKGKIKKETDKTALTWECTYTGDAIGRITESELQLRLEDGQLFANDESVSDPMFLLPGDSVKLDASFSVSAKITDMQFATMYIQFNDTFAEGSAVPVAIAPVPLDLDVGLTAEKNK